MQENRGRTFERTGLPPDRRVQMGSINRSKPVFKCAENGIEVTILTKNPAGQNIDFQLRVPCTFVVHNPI